MVSVGTLGLSVVFVCVQKTCLGGQPCLDLLKIHDELALLSFSCCLGAVSCFPLVLVLVPCPAVDATTVLASTSTASPPTTTSPAPVVTTTTSNSSTSGNQSRKTSAPPCCRLCCPAYKVWRGLEKQSQETQWICHHCKYSKIVYKTGRQ